MNSKSLAGEILSTTWRLSRLNEGTSDDELIRACRLCSDQLNGLYDQWIIGGAGACEGHTSDCLTFFYQTLILLPHKGEVRSYAMNAK